MMDEEAMGEESGNRPAVLSRQGSVELKTKSKRFAVTASVVAVAACLGGVQLLTPSGDRADRPAVERTPAAVSEPDHFFARVAAHRAATTGAETAPPEDLRRALPNQIFVARTVRGDTVEFRHSDAVVAGRIVAVEPGEGVLYDETEDEEYELVDFDHPDADGRNVLVTLDIASAVGVDTADGTFTFRLGVLGGADPEDYMASIRGIGETAVVLARRSNGRHEGEYVPAVSAALIAEVDENGALTFPALADDKRFRSGIDTVDELLEQASGPAVRTRLRSWG